MKGRIKDIKTDLTYGSVEISRGCCFIENRKLWQMVFEVAYRRPYKQKVCLSGRCRRGGFCVLRSLAGGRAGIGGSSETAAGKNRRSHLHQVSRGGR